MDLLIDIILKAGSSALKLSLFVLLPVMVARLATLAMGLHFGSSLFFSVLGGSTAASAADHLFGRRLSGVQLLNQRAGILGRTLGHALAGG